VSHVLALNSGSSSLKFGLFHVAGNALECLLNGEADAIGTSGASFHAHDAQGRTVAQEAAPLADHLSAAQRIARLLSECDAPAPQDIGHRVVHGGPRLREHSVVKAQVLQQLDAATAFAPLHTPAALALIRLAQAQYPGLPQVVCLDTCFHAHMPHVASTLPLPLALRAAGLQRYGFHGLSCESIVRQLGGAVPARLVIAHLGNGASVTAVRHGASVDTSMGLTPTGGVVMGTRSGDLDPGVLVHLMREMRLDAAAIEDLVDHRSGLLGISGVSGDLRALHQAASTHPDAQLALDMFCAAVAKAVAGMCTVLGGADMLVFTGGIGEHDAVVRSRIGAALACLGVVLDEARNRQGPGVVSSAASRCEVRVMVSQEDAQIARHTAALCQAQASAGPTTASTSA